MHLHPFQGFLVLNYWLHGNQMPTGVHSQLSYEAGIGSRRWVDAKQPNSSSTDISHLRFRLYFEKDTLASLTSSRTEAHFLPPSVKKSNASSVNCS